MNTKSMDYALGAHNIASIFANAYAENEKLFNHDDVSPDALSQLVKIYDDAYYTALNSLAAKPDPD